MITLLTEKEVELWNQLYHTNALSIMIKVDNGKAEVIYNGCDIKPMEYDKALTYFK